ncbi:hypothetical protein L5I01_12240 [Gordonia sp. HY442]|uniref:hypothetical protein n=1 Tax=Gordonia zhenghanii TaxID=2911516 RepID=UPI001F39CFA5|nr:hypothetical protein [Gordonia zhenghanii]MCF8604126.1 hypothetical protein [Gordonia zhenghanii]
MWPEDVNGIIRRSTALDVGVTDTDLKLALRSGELTLVDRGVCVRTERLPQYGVTDAVYRLKVIAAAEGRDVPVSNESAASIHGLDLLEPDHRRVHFATSRSGGGRRMATRHIHSGLSDDDVVEVDGIAVSNLVRTAIDVSAGKPFAQALAALDSARRMGVGSDELDAELHRRRIRGGAVVTAALRYSDGRSANPGESWGRAQMIEAQLPVPDLQARFELRDGSVAFTDYEWEGRLVGEFDGLRKYGRDLKPGQSIDDVVVAEKLREDALRDHVTDVARWTVSDLRDHTMIPMLRRRMVRAGVDLEQTRHASPPANSPDYKREPTHVAWSK